MPITNLPFDSQPFDLRQTVLFSSKLLLLLLLLQFTSGERNFAQTCLMQAGFTTVNLNSAPLFFMCRADKPWFEMCAVFIN